MLLTDLETCKEGQNKRVTEHGKRDNREERCLYDRRQQCPSHLFFDCHRDEMLGVGSSKWIKMILGGSGFKLVVKAETTHLSEQFE